MTQTSRGVTKLRALSACSQVVHLARVGVLVIALVVDVVCLKLVLTQCSCSSSCCMYTIFVPSFE